MNSSSPLVSVVLCTYNDEKHIAETIESVLAQSFIDFEFIIWNDGSTDQTESIIKSYNDPRIKYYYHDNTGLGTALSLSCKEANGKYIARIDGDDICYPERFQTEVDYLESHPEVVLVSSSVVYIDEYGKTLGRSFPWTWHRNIRKSINIVHPAAMFRNEIYKKTSGYLNVLACEDRILWPKLLQYGDFHIFKQPLIKYRLITTSLSHSVSVSSYYTDMLELIRQKMVKDDVIRDEDIALQNTIYRLSRVKVTSASPYNYKKSVEETTFGLLNTIFPKEIAEKVVFFLKNIYALIRY